MHTCVPPTHTAFYVVCMSVLSPCREDAWLNECAKPSQLIAMLSHTSGPFYAVLCLRQISSERKVLKGNCKENLPCKVWISSHGYLCFISYLQNYCGYSAHNCLPKKLFCIHFAGLFYQCKHKALLCQFNSLLPVLKCQFLVCRNSTFFIYFW